MSVAASLLFLFLDFFWLRIFKIFIGSIQYVNENILKYFKNPHAKRDKRGTKKEAATITFELINFYINSWRFGLLKVHVIYQKKSCTDGGNPTIFYFIWVSSHLNINWSSWLTYLTAFHRMLLKSSQLQIRIFLEASWILYLKSKNILRQNILYFPNEKIFGSVFLMLMI